jgi:hypothetical protein
MPHAQLIEDIWIGEREIADRVLAQQQRSNIGLWMMPPACSSSARRGCMSAAAIAGAITSCQTASNSTLRPPASLRPNGMAMKQSG